MHEQEDLGRTRVCEVPCSDILCRVGSSKFRLVVENEGGNGWVLPCIPVSGANLERQRAWGAIDNDVNLGRK